MSKQPTYKKYISAFIVTVVCTICIWSMAGHMLWNITRQACYQYVHHIKQERSFRDTLTIHKHTFKDAGTVVWIKKNEIRYVGRMFDIKHQTSTKDSIILVGHYDDFEHGLYKSLQKLFDNNTNSPTQQKNASWFSIVGIFPTHLHNLYSTYHSTEQQFNIWHNMFHYSITIPPTHNPPDSTV